MRSLLLLLIAGLGLLSCGRNKAVPSGVLEPEKMEAVLWDLIRADQFVSSYVVGRDTSINARAKGPQLYAAILKKYGLTDSVFQVSLDFYKKNPDRFKPILDSISLEPALAPTPVADAPTTSTPSDSTIVTAPTNNRSMPDKRPTSTPKPLAY